MDVDVDINMKVLNGYVIIIEDRVSTLKQISNLFAIVQHLSYSFSCVKSEVKT